MGAGVVAYRSYSRKEPVAGWSYLTRVRKALREYSEAFLMGSEISSLLLRDLQAFLASDAQDLPQSLKQVLKLAESEVRSSKPVWGPDACPESAGNAATPTSAASEGGWCCCRKSSEPPLI